MNNEINSLEDIKAIRKIMEESTRFLSLSGLSGVLAGVTALAGALIAWLFIDDAWSLMVVAAAVLVLSLSVAFWLSVKKAKREASISGHRFQGKCWCIFLSRWLPEGSWLLYFCARETYS